MTRRQVGTGIQLIRLKTTAMINKAMRKYDNTIYDSNTTRYGNTTQYGDMTNMMAAIDDMICGVNDTIRYEAATT
eukprot:CAMPEP_0172482906 /NCGR_PEP_ID=MMETSP1066-20121228/9615_1 /TAXON_ID=671091 /ORGANISM="Coscinodiscus wailesii, Strain CCMP2513" /LENGTH=74 /DNA_ID=CAMNT_0013246427 /DNA_START=158 /DNA_END=382 /DNA_ORIENTATION=-